MKLKYAALPLAMTAALLLGATTMPGFAAEPTAKKQAKSTAKTTTKSTAKKSSNKKTAGAVAAGAAGIAGVTSINAVAATSQTPELDGLNQDCASTVANQQLTQAEQACSKAIALAEKSVPNSKAHATAISNQAALFAAQGQPEVAEAGYKRALAMYEKALNPNHLAVATALSQLGGFYVSNDRYAEAEPLYKRALAIDERALGDKHPEVAKDLYNLSVVNSALGNFKDAEVQGQRCLDIRNKVLAANDPATIRILDHMAQQFALQGRQEEASRLYATAANASEKTYGPDAPQTQIFKVKLASTQSALSGTPTP